MSENLLTQEEIDALLSGDSFVEESSQDQGSTTGLFDALKTDNFKEINSNIVNAFNDTLTSLLIGFGQTDLHLNYITADIEQNIISKISGLEYFFVNMKFTNGINGEMKFLFNLKEVLLIADIMMGSDGSNPPEKLDEIYESAISEAMSMILGTICTNLSGVFNSTIEFETPKVEVKLVNSFSDIGISNEALFIEYDFILGSLSTNKAYQLLNLDFANTLIRKLTGETDVKKEEPKAKDVAPKAPAPAPMPQQNSNQAPPPPPPPQQQGNEQYNQQQGYYPPPPQQGYYPPPPPQGYYPPQQPPSNVKEVQFANLNSSMTANQANNIDLIMDIPLQITVELGRTKKRIRDILEYGTNSIIQLDKLAGETVDVLVNNKLIAKGEVVVIDENFGIRISQIVSPEERLNSLR